MVVCGALLLGLGLGYELRSRQLSSDTRVLADVLVLKKFTDSAFMLQTRDGQAFKAEFCPDSKVNFERGWKIKVMTYEQRKGCKSINGHNLGFMFQKDAQGNPITFLEDVAHAGY